MPELTGFAKLAWEALGGGWAGVFALALLGIGLLITRRGSKKEWQTETRKQNIEHRKKIQAQNPVDNKKAEADHREAESAIEDIINGGPDA